MSRKSEAKRQKKVFFEQRSDEEVTRLMGVIKRIPGEKILTFANGDCIGTVFFAHSDGSVGHVPGEEAAFRSLLVHGMKSGCVLAIRAFDEDHPMPVTDYSEHQGIPLRQMLFGASLGGGKWSPLSAEALLLNFTKCRCCDKRTPPNPDWDFYDLRPFNNKKEVIT